MRARARCRRWLGLAVCLGAALAAFAGGATDGKAGSAAATGPPDEIVSPTVIGEVRFPHSLHADELGFECSDCHHETDAARLRTPHPEYFEDSWPDCGSCHAGNGTLGAPRACGECHHASPASNADETLSAKVVLHRSCWGCHDSGTGEAASRSCGFCHAGAPALGEEG